MPGVMNADRVALVHLGKQARAASNNGSDLLITGTRQNSIDRPLPDGPINHVSGGLQVIGPVYFRSRVSHEACEGFLQGGPIAEHTPKGRGEGRLH